MKGVAAAVATLLALAAGCGSERPRPAADLAGVTPPSGGSGGFDNDAGDGRPPGCGQKDDGSFCDCIDVPLFTNPPNMYFVLDRSGSMADDNKWSRVRVVVAKILRGIGPRASFGATLFPGFDSSQGCAPPVEVLPIRPGDPPGATDGPTTKALLNATQGNPYGGTPTAEALRYVLPRVTAAQGRTFVILATDGGPNCNKGSGCGVEKCMPNIENYPGCPIAGPNNCCAPPNGYAESCLDDAATKSAVAALSAAGIPVYVVGIPGSAAYGTLLDELAVLGGTAQSGTPKYFRVDSSSETAILDALKRVAAQITATCEFKLKEAPADPNLVNVYLDEKILPQDPLNGWKIEGPTVTLLGAACQSVLSGDVFDVRIIAGCPTVGPR
ncbi:MAG: VWA domain-containing protein [Labilithrix sp.]|nr:VWA domain-containing protein [Labilithrix sp.]